MRIVIYNNFLPMKGTRTHVSFIAHLGGLLFDITYCHWVKITELFSIYAEICSHNSAITYSKKSLMELATCRGIPFACSLKFLFKLLPKESKVIQQHLRNRKFLIFLVKSFLGNFYGHLVIFCLVTLLVLLKSPP